MLIAKANYDRLYDIIKNNPGAYNEDDVKILLLPKLREKMISCEVDHVKRFHLEHLKDSFYLWLSEAVSDAPNTNFLYYPYHMILDYEIGNKAHKTHLHRFLNDKAREVIESRLIKGKLLSDRKEFLDFTTAHPFDWHSAAHQVQ